MEHISRKDIAFYGEDVEKDMDQFIAKYEDLMKKYIKRYSSYTNSWIVSVWITKENWQKILSTNVIKKHPLNTAGNSLVKYSPEI